MRLEKKTVKNTLSAIQLVLVMMWVSHLKYTEGYFSVYALVCILSLMCFCDNNLHNRKLTKIGTALGLTIASLLSLAATLGNYEIFQRLRNMNEISQGTNSFLNVFEAAVTFAGGIAVFYQIFLCLASRFPAVPEETQLTSGRDPKTVFAISPNFASLCTVTNITPFLFFI